MTTATPASGTCIRHGLEARGSSSSRLGDSRLALLQVSRAEVVAPRNGYARSFVACYAVDRSQASELLRSTAGRRHRCVEAVVVGGEGDAPEVEVGGLVRPTL